MLNSKSKILIVNALIFSMKNILTFLILCLFSLNIYAQQHTETGLDSVFGSEGEIYFALPSSASRVNKLSRIVGVDKINGDTVFAYANKSEYLQLIQSGVSDIIVLPHPGDIGEVPMSSDPRQILEWNYYPTYEGYEAIMEQFAADFPELCELITIGVLPSGRKLLAMHISGNLGIPQAKPEFLYTSSIHGDETTGYVLMLHLIDYLLTNYAQDERITAIVDNIDLWINPLANPDGTYAGGNNTVNGARRSNANFVDLNRNYPDPEDGPHPDGYPWQPETVAFMDFAETRNFVMSANFHGGAEVINYPWDTWSRLHADDSWYCLISHEYADTAHAYSPYGYMSGYNNGITNGYQWYSISGGRQDYMNYFQQCREVTIELSNTKIMPPGKLVNYWEYNYRSLLNYIEQVNYGIRGIVTDTITGEAVVAQVFINGHDKDSSMVFSAAGLGDYYRPLKAGSYNISFYADGYFPKTLSQVSIQDYASVTANVKLWNGTAIPAFTASDTVIVTGNQVQFYDLSGGNPNEWLWTFEGADTPVSTEPNPIVKYSVPGTYNVSLYVSNVIGGNQLVKQDYITVTSGYFIGMQGTTTCSTLFYDSQGPGQPYQPDEDLVTTFISSDPEKVLKVSFRSFDVEYSANCGKDRLYIYDGPNISSPLLAELCGAGIPEDIYGGNPGGALTFRFVSDHSNQGQGWEAEINCVEPVGIGMVHDFGVQVYPNPVRDHILSIRSAQAIQQLEMYSSSGALVHSSFPSLSFSQIDVNNLNQGLYLLLISTARGQSRFKVVIMR